jgi:TonB family protein
MKAPPRCVRLATIIGLLLAAHGVSVAANPHTWIEVRSPHFVVVSNTSERDARQVANQFETIRAVFLDYFGNLSGNDQPVVIVAAKDWETLKPLLPESWTKKGAAHRVGLFLNGPDRSYIGLRLDVSFNRAAYEPFEPIYHEYFHYVSRRMISQLPVWVVEGLAEVYGNTRIEGKNVYIGAPSPSNITTLRRTPLLPLDTLFDVNRSSPYYNEQNKISIFYAESWALTHYLLSRDWREDTHRLQDFVDLVRKGTAQREAANRTIGDPKALQADLDKYVQSFVFTAGRLNAPTIDEGNFSVRTLSDAESLTVRADFVANDGQYAKAQEMLEESIKLDPKLAVAYESMGYLYLQQGKSTDAEKWSAQAVGMNPQSWRANYLYAASLLRGYMLDDETIAKAESSLRTVLKINPEFAPAHDLLASVLSRPGPTQKLDEAYMATLQAVSLEPGNIHYRLRGVDVQEKRGRAEDAIRVASLAVSLATTPADKAMAEASLAGAKQFQISQRKMKELQETQASAEPAGKTLSSEHKESAAAASPSRQVEILSDTMGVDFGPYLDRVVQVVRQNWYILIPEEARPPVMKQGKVAIQFAVMKDGSVQSMQLAGSSGDVALDRAAWGSITASSPFAPLPTEFKGQYLDLRFYYYYNLSPNLVAAKTEQPNLRISPSGPLNLVAGSTTQQFTAGVGGVDSDVDWAVYGNNCEEVDCGTISGTGLYTAPATVKEPLRILVTAKETSSPFKSAFARVTIIPPSPKK